MVFINPDKQPGFFMPLARAKGKETMTVFSRTAFTGELSR